MRCVSKRFWWIVAALGFLASLAPAGKPTVVVTTTALGEAARGLLGERDGELARVVEIVPPGACPGHFDLSPRILPQLQAAALVVRHDYQAGLDAQMRSVAGDGLRVLSAPSSGSLLVPSHFAALQDFLCAELSDSKPEWSDALRERASSRQSHLVSLESEIRKTARSLRGRRVIASAMQAGFCRWLGMEVVGTIARPEDMTPRQLERLEGVQADFVVANLQSGVRAARSLADRKGLALAVLSNFPRAEGFGETYDELVRENVRRLVKACPQKP